ncbi:hypothetical protein BHE97_17750 [Aeromicrobium sp. PE09-221]|uniref:TRAP transporter substrate-binding protein DctP n=1 Tax=Aeromicrobium sp. PE09-221 TaxID=1898043 RepID=UPI000B639A4A|nr:TRAP transporter substrate-binding protein DctP [Aeromicrobium sp. PE09-221]OUZ07343.1 hypothetical protein BHE97_17750 [Aeromicrobium sp. PE09-221]
MRLRLIAGTTLGALAFALGGCAIPGEDGDGGVTTLTLATGIPAEHMFSTDHVEPFIEAVESGTDGSIEIDYFPAGQLGDTADAHTLVADGVADIAYFVVGFDPGRTPISASLFGMPGTFATAEQGSQAYHQISQQEPTLSSDFLDHGVRPLFAMATPPTELYTKGAEINSPEDLKGMRVRTAGGTASEYLSHVGANPIQLTSSELYGALDTGVIDAVAVDPTNLRGYGLAELTAFATLDSGLGGAGFGFIINDDVYAALGDDEKDVLTKASEELLKGYAKAQTQAVAEIVEQDLAKATVRRMEGADRQAWTESFEEFNATYLEAQSADFREVYEAFREAAQ